MQSVRPAGFTPACGSKEPTRRARSRVMDGAPGCSWTAPFPLISDGHGGFSLNPLEDRVFIAGLWSALAASILGASGKGRSRVAVVLSGPLLAVCSLLGWLGNHR